MPRWAWWHQSSGPDDYRIRELLRGIWDLHAMYGVATWLWRGQASRDFDFEPGMHTRLKTAKEKLDDPGVEARTTQLIVAAKAAGFDVHEGIRLPEMPLLALIQHHGAATPLLDVSLDPMLGLYMAVVSPSVADDDRDGVLFAIAKPPKVISAFDSRQFATIYNKLPNDEALLYSAPDVSERLRIQRGHFLLGRVSTADHRVTIPLKIEGQKTKLADAWIWKRMEASGGKGALPKPTVDIAVFKIAKRLKGDLRKWLEERTGLTKDFVYPTPWHQPHLDRFATSHGRRAEV